jgi:hypothetical protein
MLEDSRILVSRIELSGVPTAFAIPFDAKIKPNTHKHVNTNFVRILLFITPPMLVIVNLSIKFTSISLL